MRAEAERTGYSLSHMVRDALSSALGVEHHSLFQISPSCVLVKDAYKGCMTVDNPSKALEITKSGSARLRYGKRALGSRLINLRSL